MATINGVEFNLVNWVFGGNNRNVLGRSPGSSTNSISNYGIDGLTISLTGEESTIAAYDAVIDAFMTSGAELIIWAGWKFDIYSTSNNLAESGSFSGKDFPYRFDIVCSDPYRHSTTETTRTKTITANNQEWTADNSANDITTAGSVAAVPNIIITAHSTEQLQIEQTSKFS